MLSIWPAYAYFCDDNDLPRIDISVERKRKNLLLMALLALTEAFKMSAAVKGRVRT